MRLGGGGRGEGEGVPGMNIDKINEQQAAGEVPVLYAQGAWL